MLSEVFLGLGSNLGDRAGNLARAVAFLQQVSTAVTVSATYETSPHGFGGQPPFVNAACRIWTSLDPFQLLERIGEVQAAIGGRRAFVNGPRTIDLDILIFGRWVISTPSLTIPHPRMAEREFVLRPLAHIAPELEHPVLHETVRSMLERLETGGSLETLSTMPLIPFPAVGSGHALARQEKIISEGHSHTPGKWASPLCTPHI